MCTGWEDAWGAGWGGAVVLWESWGEPMRL